MLVYYYRIIRFFKRIKYNIFVRASHVYSYLHAKRISRDLNKDYIKDGMKYDFYYVPQGYKLRIPGITVNSIVGDDYFISIRRFEETYGIKVPNDVTVLDDNNMFSISDATYLLGKNKR